VLAPRSARFRSHTAAGRGRLGPATKTIRKVMRTVANPQRLRANVVVARAHVRAYSGQMILIFRSDKGDIRARATLYYDEVVFVSGTDITDTSIFGFTHTVGERTMSVVVPSVCPWPEHSGQISLSVVQARPD